MVRAYKNNCADWARSGSTQDGVYLIDPDGDGPVLPFNVSCYNLTDPLPLTYMEPDQTSANVSAPTNDEWWEFIITYGDIPYAAINELALRSDTCWYDLTFKCQNLPLGVSKWRNYKLLYNMQIRWWICPGIIGQI